MKIHALLAILLALLIAATLAIFVLWQQLFVCDAGKPAGPAIGHVLRIMGCPDGR